MSLVRPQGIQLRRKLNFNLQATSLALNGLPAMSVARPHFWGNPWVVGLIACACRSPGECTHNTFRCESAQDAVTAFKAWAGNWPSTRRTRLHELQGKNLACYCAIGAPCHRDVLIDLANP